MSRPLLVVLVAALHGCGGKAIADVHLGATGGDGSGDAASNTAPAPDADLQVPNSGVDAGCFDADRCSLSSAEVACSADSDCTSFGALNCDCVWMVFGVNNYRPNRCAPPPCPDAYDCSVFTYVTQDCGRRTDWPLVDSQCVAGRCLTAKH